MRRIIGAIAGAAGVLLLVDCTHVPLLIAGMDAEDIQRVSNDDLCRSSDIFLQTRGRRFQNIENEIDRRGLPCGDNEDGQPVQAAAPAPVSEPVTVPASPSQISSRALQNTNMRSGPGTNYAVVGVLRPGDVVMVLRVAGGWCECMNSARRTVFVRCNLLAPPPGGWSTILAGISSLPRFTAVMPYPNVRAQLMAAGWQPFRPAAARPLRGYLQLGCAAGDGRCQGFSETIFCAGTGQATCWYTWRRGGEYLLIAALGEAEGQAFGEARLCSGIALSDAHPWEWCQSINSRSSRTAGGIQLTRIEDNFSSSACRLSLTRAGAVIHSSDLVGGGNYLNNSYDIGINGQRYTLNGFSGFENFILNSTDHRISVRIREGRRAWVSYSEEHPGSVHQASVSVTVDGSRRTFNAYHFCGDGALGYDFNPNG